MNLIFKLQHICLKFSLKMPPTSLMHVSVIGSGRDGTPKSLLICTDTTRYLVNCGEGTQRIITEHRSKASRIQHAFFTRMSWDYFSGLLGVALTVRAAGVKKMFVHGPSNGAELMKLTRHFADANTTDVVQSDILNQPFIDQDFRITAFELSDQDTDGPDAKRPHLDKPDKPTYAYFFQAFRLNNKLDPKECIAHGIPPHVMRSPAIRKLTEGEPLILEDGRTIAPSDVTTSAPTPQNILVVDCPHSSYVSRLLKNSDIFHALSISTEAAPEKKNRGTVAGVSLVVHFLPRGLFSEEAYQEFVKKLEDYGQTDDTDGTESTRKQPVRHLVLDGSSQQPPISGIYAQSAVLNRFFDSEVYPKLASLKTPPSFQPLAIEPFSPVVFGAPLLTYHLRPHRGFSTDHCINLSEENLINESFDPLYVSQVEAEEAFKKMREELRVASEKRTPDKDAGRLQNQDWPELIFLGTASSAPSKYRNISGILLRTSEDECILMDCGEGTLNQLYAMLGVEGTHRLLRGLKLILITHMHADHHGGVLTIAAKYRQLMFETNAQPSALPVLAPPPFWRWTKSFSDLFEEPHIELFSIPKVFTPPENTVPTDHVASGEVFLPADTSSSPIWSMGGEDAALSQRWQDVLTATNLKIGPVKVPHTGTSWAYVVERPPSRASDDYPAQAGWKIVYSGDTPPCSQLSVAGRGCDLLIHEATMADGYEDQAVAARHSTTSEAISVGRAMKAKFILLNHFSQRFARLPNFDTFQENIAPTFDFMRVRLRDLWKLPYFLPYYKFAFAKHWDLQQTRSDANQWRKVRSERDLELARMAVREAVGPR
uniref:ribonuclease Z n=1 Tax=Schistocephalus solidus TaxID=70667 RepID=A0A0X3PRM5_SCHSO